MAAMESTRPWFGAADGAAGEDGAVWFGAEGNRSGQSIGISGRSDGAVDGAEGALWRQMPGAAFGETDLSDVRVEEVVRLRVAIASGCYGVSAAALADKMIASFSGGLTGRGSH